MRQKIIVVGPAYSQTGYGEQCRFALRALLAHDKLFDVYLKPINWGNSSWLLPNDSDRDWLDNLVRKTAIHLQGGGASFDVSLQVTIPNEWERIAPLNIGYTAGIETTKVAPEWLQQSGLMDRIITISNHSKSVFVETVYNAVVEETGASTTLRCTTPIDVVHYPVRLYDSPELELDLEYDFNYLTVSQWGPRKNLENTIRWWIEEFADQEVGLVVKTNLIKTSIIDRMHTLERLEHIARLYPDRKCKIYMLHGNMTAAEMMGLYQHPKIKCLVSLTHGEGFGLPLFEAAYNALPIVAPNWSGHTDFLYAMKKKRKKGKTVKKNHPHFAQVEYNLAPVPPEAVWEGVIQPDSLWCYPKESSYKETIRKVYDNYRFFEKQAESLKSSILKRHTPEEKYAEFVESVWPSKDREILNEIEEMFKDLSVDA